MNSATQSRLRRSLAVCCLALVCYGLYTAGTHRPPLAPAQPRESKETADRDIVFSAEQYQFTGLYYSEANPGAEHLARQGDPDEQTLTEVGAYYLYRVNPDGTGMTRITQDPNFDDILPHWSPDGKTILFVRKTRPRETDACSGSASIRSVCLADPEGRRIRTLYRLSGAAGEQEITDCCWSPDGRMVAIVVGGEDKSSLLLLDVLAGKTIRRIEAVTAFTWSPRDGKLYLAGEDKVCNRIFDPRTGVLTPLPKEVLRLSLRHFGWLPATGVFVGDGALGESEDSFLYTPSYAPGNRGPGGRVARKITWETVSAYTEADQDSKEAGISRDAHTSHWFSAEGRQWRGLPALGPDAALAEAYHGRSDGGQRDVFRTDLRTGKAWLLHQGQLVAVSPDGKQCAVATDEWTGPYKRGGRRCGPLEVLPTTLPVGERVREGREVTSPLMSFWGGDWRRPLPVEEASVGAGESSPTVSW